jgi:hypothetical protein
MRNIWYPAGLAEYVTKAQLKMMKDVVVERDFAFGVRQPMVEGPAQELAKVVAEEARIRLLSVSICDFAYLPRMLMVLATTDNPAHKRAHSGMCLFL